MTMASPSTQPYLLRAIYEWCADAGYTPQILVKVDGRTRVPPGYVKDGEIVLNIGSSATRSLTIDNDWIQFSARFSGTSYEIAIPVDRVAAIFARENGEGLQFPVSDEGAAPPEGGATPDGEPPPRGRPSLKVVK